MSAEYQNLLLTLIHKSKRIMNEEKLLMHVARNNNRMADATQHYNRMRVHGLRIIRINRKLQAA